MPRLLNFTTIDCDTTSESYSAGTKSIGHVGINTIATVQARSVGETSWSTGVLSLQWRIDGRFAWQDFAPALTLVSGTPFLRAIDIFGVPEIGAVVTTTESGVRLEVGIWAEGSE